MRKKYLSLIIGAFLALNLAGVSVSAASKYPEWQKINGVYYYVNPDGSKATGWTKYDGQWYYLKQDGSWYTGWIKDGEDWYYLFPGGMMGVNTVVDGHYIGSDGKLSITASDPLTLSEGYPSATQNAFAETIQLLEYAESNPTQENVQAVVDSFTAIPIGIEDIKAYDTTGQDAFDRAYLRIIDLIYKLPSDSRDAEFIRFDEKIADSWAETVRAGYNSFFRTYVGYINGIYIPEIQDQITRVWHYINDYNPQDKNCNISTEKNW